jgi:hypothetical protein
VPACLLGIDARVFFVALGVWAKVRVDESKQLRAADPSLFFFLFLYLSVSHATRSLVCVCWGAPLFNSNGFLRAGMAQNYYTSPSLLFGNLIIGPRVSARNAWN